MATLSPMGNSSVTAVGEEDEFRLNLLHSFSDYMLIILESNVL